MRTPLQAVAAQPAAAGGLCVLAHGMARHQTLAFVPHPPGADPSMSRSPESRPVRQRTVAVLADESQVPLNEVTKLYEREHAALADRARITVLTHIFAICNAQTILCKRAGAQPDPPPGGRPDQLAASAARRAPAQQHGSWQALVAAAFGINPTADPDDLRPRRPAQRPGAHNVRGGPDPGRRVHRIQRQSTHPGQARHRRGWAAAAVDEGGQRRAKTPANDLLRAGTCVVCAFQFDRQRDRSAVAAGPFGERADGLLPDDRWAAAGPPSTRYGGRVGPADAIRRLQAHHRQALVLAHPAADAGGLSCGVRRDARAGLAVAGRKIARWGPRSLAQTRPGGRRWAVGLAVALGGLGLAIAGALQIIAPVFRFPKPTGAFAISTLTCCWVDASCPDIYTADHTPPSGTDGAGLVARCRWPVTCARTVPAKGRRRDDGLCVQTRHAGVLFSRFKAAATHAVAAAPVAAGPSSDPVLILPVGATGFRQMSSFQVEALASHDYMR